MILYKSLDFQEIDSERLQQAGEKEPPLPVPGVSSRGHVLTPV